MAELFDSSLDTTKVAYDLNDRLSKLEQNDAEQNKKIQNLEDSNKLLMWDFELRSLIERYRIQLSIKNKKEFDEYIADITKKKISMFFFNLEFF